MNAMFRKELRDAVRWLPVGTILLTVMLYYLLRQPGFYQNLTSQLYFFAWICSAMFGFLLSLVTFLPEERDAARAFLVHRGISLDRIFKMRVAVGLLVYGVSMMLPLVCVAIYLANVGPMHAPVSPWQVFPASVAVVFCSGFYFAGIIVSCRPSYWLGTRLLPIVFAIVTAITTVSLLIPGGDHYFVVTASTHLIGTIGLAVLATASRHAFQRLPSSIAPASATIRSNALLLTLLVSCLFFFPVLSLFIVAHFQVSPSEIMEFKCTKSGEPFLTTRSYTDSYFGYKSLKRTVAMTNGDNFAEKKSDDLPTIAMTYLVPLSMQSHGWDSRTVGMLQHRKSSIVFDPMGYLLAYERVRVANGERLILTNIVGADRVSIPSQPRGLSFRSYPRLFAASQRVEWRGDLTIPTRTKEEEMNVTFVINSEGVYRIDWKTGEVVHKIKGELTSYAELYESTNMDNHYSFGNYFLLLRSGHNVTLFRRKSTDPQKASIDPTSDFVQDGSFSIPTSGERGSYIFCKDSSNWTYVSPNSSSVPATQYKIVRSVDSTVDTYEFQTPSEIIEATNSRNHWAIPLFIGTSPSIVLIGFFALARWMNDGTIHNIHFVMLFIQTLVSASLAYMAARHRRLSKSQRWWWVITGFLLGIGTSLAIIAIYPRVYFVACASCNRRRRVEQEACEHCGAQWDPAIEEGIEVFERQTLHHDATHPLVTL